MNVPKPVYRILGNFGVGFSSPFVGNNIGEVLYNYGFTIDQVLTIALLGAIFTTTLSISKEALELGRERWAR